MCFVCDVILCKSCACATTRSRTRCKTSKFRKHAWNRRGELSDRTRQETGKIEKSPDTGTESQVAEGSFAYLGDNKIRNTVSYIANKNEYGLKRMDPSVYTDAAAVLEEEIILKDNNVQLRNSPVFHDSLTEMSEYDGVPEVVEESILKVDKTQLNMSQVLDGSLLGRTMY